jgi:hypothetical protein
LSKLVFFDAKVLNFINFFNIIYNWKEHGFLLIIVLFWYHKWLFLIANWLYKEGFGHVLSFVLRPLSSVAIVLLHKNIFDSFPEVSKNFFHHFFCRKFCYLFLKFWLFFCGNFVVINRYI